MADITALGGLLGPLMDNPQTFQAQSPLFSPRLNAGLLGAAQGLLGASGFQQTPVSLGQALGQGLGGFQGGQRQFDQDQLAQQALQQKIQRQGLLSKIQGRGSPFFMRGPDGKLQLAMGTFDPQDGDVGIQTQKLPEGFSVARPQDVAKADIDLQKQLKLLEEKEKLAKRDTEFKAGVDISKAEKIGEASAQRELDTAKKKLDIKSASVLEEKINLRNQEARRVVPGLRKVLKGLELIETGKAAQAKRVLGEFLPFVTDPSDAQNLRAQLQALVLPVLANFPGALSDKELEFASATVANFGNTNKANIMIVKHMMETFNKAVEEKRSFQRFKSKHKGRPDIIKGFDFISIPKTVDELRGITDPKDLDAIELQLREQQR